MRNYIIKTSHEIEIDEFNEGLTNYVNSYNLDAQIKAETPREAIEKYFENNLYYSFDFKNAYIFHLEGDGDEKNILCYDILTNQDGDEANEREREMWQNENLTLYNNRIYLKIYELKPAVI